MPQHWQVDRGLDEVWRTLRTRGYRIGVASNFDGRLETICSALSPLSTADRIFHSARLGTRKPGLRFFRAIEEALGQPAAALTLVGDDLEVDYRAARAAGWNAFWLNRGSTVLSNTGPLSDLRQLVGCLSAIHQTVGRSNR